MPVSMLSRMVNRARAGVRDRDRCDCAPDARRLGSAGGKRRDIAPDRQVARRRGSLQAQAAATARVRAFHGRRRHGRCRDHAGAGDGDGRACDGARSASLRAPKPEAIAARLAQNPDVEFAQPDFAATAYRTTNDSLLWAQSYLSSAVGADQRLRRLGRDHGIGQVSSSRSSTPAIARTRISRAESCPATISSPTRKWPTTAMAAMPTPPIRATGSMPPTRRIRYFERVRNRGQFVAWHVR